MRVGDWVVLRSPGPGATEVLGRVESRDYWHYGHGENARFAFTVRWLVLTRKPRAGFVHETQAVEDDLIAIDAVTALSMIEGAA